MIIRDLSKFIIFDDVRLNAKPGEVYFVSHLLGNEALTIPDDWPGRIYTSQFIFDVLCKKKPEVHPKHFKILQPNVSVKLKSKEKTLSVIMFETEEVTHNVMFLFDDKTMTHLYTGVFNEIGGLFRNEQFMSCVESGIDNIYVDCTRGRGSSYIFTEDVVEDIKQILESHSDTPFAIVVPHFGYEKLLVQLIKVFPQVVYPTKNQRKVLSKLGFKELLSKDPIARITILPPGITPEFIESNQVVVVYIVEGKSSPTTGACGMYLRQWSPLPSLMDIQALLDIIRPKNVFPIRKDSLEDSKPLPAMLQWFTRKGKSNADEDTSKSTYSSGGLTDNESSFSFNSTCSNAKGSENANRSSLASTEVFRLPPRRSETAVSPNPKPVEQKCTETPVDTTKDDDLEGHGITSSEERRICGRFIYRRNILDFDDSDD